MRSFRYLRPAGSVVLQVRTNDQQSELLDPEGDILRDGWQREFESRKADRQLSGVGFLAGVCIPELGPVATGRPSGDSES